MIAVFNLLVKIIKQPQKTFFISKSRKIYTFSTNNIQYRLSKNFIKQNITLVNNLSDISWNEILFRKIFVTAPPKKDLIKSVPDRLKKFLIHCLFLSVNAELKILNFHSILFQKKSENTLYTHSFHCFEIYRTHLKHFNIKETFKNYKHYILFFFYILSKSLKDKNVDHNSGIAVFINPSSPYIIYSFLNLHPNKRIIVRYHDMLTEKDIKTILSLRKRKPQVEIETYSRKDALDYSLKYRPNGVDPTFMKSLNKDFRTAIYRFYGASGGSRSLIQNRTEILHQINEKLFQIYPLAPSWIDYKTIASVDHFIPYAEFAQQSALCEIYVDLARTQVFEGFSFRTVEALFLNRKILTNRTNITNEAFYHPRRVFILGKDTPEKLKYFLENDPPSIPENILKIYDSSLWWTDKDPLEQAKL